ncbi:DUF6890 family protein [Haemophilus parahaemolyticus]|uniref:DUF6890 family protein n=1 Tax=Haemophilus parahaemolyticus TaxID=735 RepID=UPI001403A053|nr:hypothetical protein [Haemophilus parahaemolyticus]
MKAIEENTLEQAYALREHYLPHADNSEKSLARAIWLHKNYFECLAVAVNNGIATAFKG